MNVTSDEMKNAGDRIENLYVMEAYPARTDRAIRVDPTGYVQWSGQYWSNRQKGQDHETAIVNVENQIRQIWHNQQIADGVIPPDPVPETPPKPARSGAVRFTGRTWTDDRGCFLGMGFSFFWVPRAWRDYRDRYVANMQYGQRHGFNYYRGFVTTGGWPDPDGWRDAGAFYPWAVEVLPQWLDDAYNTYGLRCSLTLFDGEVQFPSFEEQDRYVREVCGILRPRMHTVTDVQIANEYGPCRWDYPEGIDRLRAHCRTVRGELGPAVPVSLSSRNAVMNDGSYGDAQGEARVLFEGLLPDVVTMSVNHDSRETGHVCGPWRPVRQGWERVLHDEHTGQPLEPDASCDDEPIGPASSVAEECDPSRLVQKFLVDYVSGRCAYTFHPDPGIWSDLRNPPCVGGPSPMGCYKLIADHPACTPFAESMTKILALLPPDLPNWDRTRHGLTNPPHPFGLSFEPRDGGAGYTQIWPDGYTDHGVVRSYAAINGNHWIAPLTGIKDRIDLKWDWALTGAIYRCKDGEKVGDLTAAARSYTIPESVDTDVLIVGQWV